MPLRHGLSREYEGFPFSRLIPNLIGRGLRLTRNSFLDLDISLAGGPARSWSTPNQKMLRMNYRNLKSLQHTSRSFSNGMRGEGKGSPFLHNFHKAFPLAPPKVHVQGEEGIYVIDEAGNKCDPLPRLKIMKPYRGVFSHRLFGLRSQDPRWARWPLVGEPGI